jgi:hypothetical protein
MSTRTVHAVSRPLATANPELTGTPRLAATVLDLALHRERAATNDNGIRSCMAIENLPDGVFVTDDEHDTYLVLSNHVLRWSPAGYERAIAALQYPVRILTPPSVVRALAAGYPTDIHDSAFETLDRRS